MGETATRHRASGLGFALASALAFGGSGPFARPLIDAGVDPLQVTWLRVAGAALLLLPLAVRHRRVLRTHPWLLLAYGAFPMAGVQAFYFAAISRIPVGVALLIEFLGPILVLAWIRLVRRQRIPRAAAVGVALALAGLACLVEVWAGVRLDPIGLALALGAAVCQAGYFLLSDAAGDEVDPLAVISYGALVAAAIITVIARPWTLPWPLLAGEVELAGVSTSALVSVGWLALVSTAVAYVTGVAGVRRLSPGVAGAVAYLEVVTGIVLAWLMLGEALTPAQTAGAVIVVAGAFIGQSAVGGSGDAPARADTAADRARTGA
ncbi:EamA family transporter [Marinitenerispora sediminis]|uniref:EamA family transporter n=1 Tax=Marinitenerispora sediminis TaxID=1931232 RepID=A0A368TAL7_9ACTN|nr:EamA family transporter [Marinitenerispora sediminis]RCV53390.1 EamA family transporter [Marinitenerispora sediminis]RCV58414.1 EamA family transporter [Marinitenerispora sediminis]RCV61805.1 EamA family transporter [Marinitenerispora sediminis]